MNGYFLADDLSGALDAAAAFHRAGQRVRVALSADAWLEVGTADVLGLTTETRNQRPEAAAEVVRSAIASARATGARFLYKKIDSTLRGPVAAEIGALAASLPDVKFLFCPANPRVGRTVESGVLLVNGVPVAETEFGRDPVGPVRESAIHALLGEAARSHVIIADARSEADLAAAVARIDSAGEPWVAIGSGALAVPVAARLFASLPPSASRTKTPPDGPVLFVCGSAHPINSEQANHLTRERAVPQHRVTTSTVEPAAKAAIASVRAQGRAALMLDAARVDSAEALRAITAAARHVILETGSTRVFVTGGETAFALGREFGIASLEFVTEVEPGLSLSDVAGRRSRKRDEENKPIEGAMRWAVKPGGFGDARTWIRGFDALHTAD